MKGARCIVSTAMSNLQGWTGRVLIAAGILAAAVGVLAYGLGSPGATLLGPAVVKLPGGQQEVALTFDDGPSVPATARILDILREQHVRATFFVCGVAAQRHPDLVRRIVAEGHGLGNHTYSHPYLHLKSRWNIAAEIDRTQGVLERITGRRPQLFRPPYGVRWFPLWPLLRQRGLTMVLWSDWGHDGQADPRAIVKETLERLKPGAIILLHDGFEARPDAQIHRSATVAALPGIIEGARRAGYTFVTVRADPGPATPIAGPGGLAWRLSLPARPLSRR
jgi:peptidoglycan/xylan/chitin deacetylase (PgdA/CDA1 family)